MLYFCGVCKFRSQLACCETKDSSKLVPASASTEHNSRKVFPLEKAEDTVLSYSGFLEYGSENGRFEELVCPHSGSQRSGSESRSDQTVSVYSDCLL